MQTKLNNKNFIMVLFGQIISLFGNAILRFALPLYLLNETGSASLFGFVSAIAFLPLIILMPLGGIIADRLNKRNIMVILDITTAAITLLFALLLGKLNIILLLCCILILLYGIQGIYQPTVQASIPLLVPQNTIMQGNAMINLVSSLSNLIGPILGGILFSQFGIYPILYVSIICFFFSAIMELFITIPFQKRKLESSIVMTGYHDIKQSLDYMIIDNPEYFKVSLVIAAINLFLSACIIIGIPIVINKNLGLDITTANRLFGYVQGAMGAGSILGGLSAGALANKLSLKSVPIMITSCGACLLIIAAAFTFSFPLMITYVITMIATFLMMVFATFISIQLMSQLQILTPTYLLGKIISCTMCISMCASPIGQAIYGVLFQRFSDNPEYIFTGARSEERRCRERVSFPV